MFGFSILSLKKWNNSFSFVLVMWVLNTPNKKEDELVLQFQNQNKLLLQFQNQDKLQLQFQNQE
jgi:hypothetical protein